jgi:integrase/recombinase XerD
MIAIDIDDLDIKNRVLIVRDRGEGIKNYHERKAVLTKDCAEALEKWVEIRPNQDKALFINVYGRRLTRSGLHKIVSGTAKRAGINRNVSAHLLRHTTATTMLRSGIPITEVALQLGHRSLASQYTETVFCPRKHYGLSA